MAYKALYRTYRPQTFKDVTGQEVVVKTLQNAIINNKISHAYLFSGPRGTGKTSVARIFAKALNCVNLEDGEPCDKCTSCQEISDGINPDVIEIDAASNNGVDEIRDIREKVKFLPSGSRYKIYIIDEVHMLSGGAFNALLKTLEEPPKHVVFILATTEPQKLPATIISRCQRFEFKALTVEEISERVKLICKLEDVSITEEALNSIGESAEGGMRDALSILDQAISYGNKEITIDDINEVTGSLSFEKIITLAKAIEEKDVHVTLECVNELIGEGKEISKIINSLLVFYRDVLLYKSVGTSGFSKFVFTEEKFQELCLNIPMSKIMYFVDVLSDIQNKVRYTTTPNVFLEIALIKMCNISVDELDIMKRVTELENKINNLGDVDFSNNNVNAGAVDNEKLNMLDARVNQIVSELNRLELRKQVERIDLLADNINKVNMQDNNVNFRDFENELQHLKDKVEEMDLFVNKGGNDEGIPDEIYKRLDALEENKSTENNSNSNVDITKLTNKIKELEDRLESEEKDTQNVDLNDIYNRLDVLENTPNNEPTKVVERVQNNIDLSEVYKRIEALENSVRSEMNAINTITENNPGNVDLTSVYQRLNVLENNKNTNAINQNNPELNNKVNELENSYLGVMDDITELKEKVTTLEKNKGVPAGDVSEDLSEISDKLMFLERRVYEIMAGELANRKPAKKTAKKNNGQIMLFGDDILSISNFDTNNKENFDFDELEKTAEEIKAEEEKEALELQQKEQEKQAETTNDDEDNQEELEEENIDNDFEITEEEVVETEQVKEPEVINNNQENTVKNDTKLEAKETDNSVFITGNYNVDNNLNNAVTNSILNEEAKPNLFENNQNNVSEKAPVEEAINEEIHEEKTPEIEVEKHEERQTLFDVQQDVVIKPKEEEKEPIKEEVHEQKNEHLGLFETASSIIERPVVEKKSNNVVSKYFDVEKGEKVINKERSSIVVREKPETNNDYALEQDIIARESEDVKEAEPVVETPQEGFAKDKFASYNVKYIEQLMHDSRSIESRNDKVRIEQLWKVMTRGARPEYLSIMETLQEGKIAVVGNKEFIIVFPNASLCNQVMRAKFKDIAIRILHELLGDTYNYIALPVDVWTAKSIEYKQQYQIGIKYPTLKPLDIKGLEIISDDEEYENENEKAINQTIEMFGRDNINFE